MSSTRNAITQGHSLRLGAGKAPQSLRSLVRLGLLTGALQDYFRLRPGEHAILQGNIPCRLEAWVFVDRCLRPLVQRGTDRSELDHLPGGPGNEENHRQETEDGAQHHEPTSHGIFLLDERDNSLCCSGDV